MILGVNPMFMGGGRSLYPSVKFDGTEKLVTVEDAALSTANPYTLESWFKLDSGLTSVVFFLGVHSFQPEPLLGRVSDGLRAYYNNGRMSGSHTILAGIWYHYALVYDGTSVTAYIDGSEVNSSSSLDTNVIQPGHKIYVGGDNDDALDTRFIPVGTLYGTRLSLAAKYTSNFTPNTTYGVEDDTDFLLASENGNIVDATGNYTFESFGAGITASNEVP